MLTSLEKAGSNPVRRSKDGQVSLTSLRFMQRSVIDLQLSSTIGPVAQLVEQSILGWNCLVMRPTSSYYETLVSSVRLRPGPHRIGAVAQLDRAGDRVLLFNYRYNDGQG